MKYIFFLLFILNPLFSYDEKNSFSNTQKYFELLRDVVLKEEAIAKAYEEYLINEKAIPLLNDLISEDYLGIDFKINFSSPLNDFFENIILDSNLYRLNYRLKDTISIKEETKDFYQGLLSLYEGFSIRSKSFININENNEKEIIFILENSIAKNFYELIRTQNNNPILECSNPNSKKYCTKENHIYLYNNETKNSDELLMYYDLDKYYTGPIIINDNVALYTKEEFLNLPLGVILYNFKGKKFIKSTNAIEEVR